MDRTVELSLIEQQIADEAARKAVAAYREELITIEEECLFLSHAKFHLGDCVQKITASYFDNVFDVGSGNVGIIVGWDKEYGYYRVYYNHIHRYTGVREETIEKYDGEIPEHLRNVDPFRVDEIEITVNIAKL